MRIWGTKNDYYKLVFANSGHLNFSTAGTTVYYQVALYSAFSTLESLLLLVAFGAGKFQSTPQVLDLSP